MSQEHQDFLDNMHSHLSDMAEDDSRHSAKQTVKGENLGMKIPAYALTEWLKGHNHKPSSFIGKSDRQLGTDADEGPKIIKGR